MRTKTLLLTAAVAAVGMASSNAQVFSENAVGYYVRDLAFGYNLIANQLNNGDNVITTLMPDGQASLDNATLFKWDSVNQTFPAPDTYINGAGGWYNSELTGLSETTLSPGEAAFVLIAVANPDPITFVGEVPQGDFSIDIGLNYSVISQPTPQALALDAIGDEIPAVENDLVFFWDADEQKFEGAKLFFADTWFNNEDFSLADMSVDVGEGFFYLRDSNNGTTTWNRTFNVN